MSVPLCTIVLGTIVLNTCNGIRIHDTRLVWSAACCCCYRGGSSAILGLQVTEQEQQGLEPKRQMAVQRQEDWKPSSQQSLGGTACSTIHKIVVCCITLLHSSHHVTPCHVAQALMLWFLLWAVC